MMFNIGNADSSKKAAATERSWYWVPNPQKKKEQMNNLIFDTIFRGDYPNADRYIRHRAEEILGFRPRSKKFSALVEELISYHDQKAWKRQDRSVEQSDQQMIGLPKADEICRQLEALTSAIEMIKAERAAMAAERAALAAERAAFNADREHLRELTARAIESVAQLPDPESWAPAVAEAEVVELDDLEPEPSGQRTRPARPKASGK